MGPAYPIDDWTNLRLRNLRCRAHQLGQRQAPASDPDHPPRVAYRGLPPMSGQRNLSRLSSHARVHSLRSATPTLLFPDPAPIAW